MPDGTKQNLPGKVRCDGVAGVTVRHQGATPHPANTGRLRR